MRRFTYTELGDIVTSYRQAKYPELQIGILAELYACQEMDILDALALKGVSVPRRRGTHIVWTEEKENRLLEMYQDNMTNRQIADVLHTTEDSVAERLKKLRNTAGTDADPALRRKRTTWTKEMYDRLLELYRQNMTDRQIAGTLHVTPKAVSHKLSNLRKMMPELGTRRGGKPDKTAPNTAK